MKFEKAPPRRAPMHGRQAIKASPDENYLKLRIGLKRRLFNFCFFYIKKGLMFCLVSLFFLVLYKKKFKGIFVKNID